VFNNDSISHNRILHYAINLSYAPNIETFDSLIQFIIYIKVHYDNYNTAIYKIAQAKYDRATQVWPIIDDLKTRIKSSQAYKSMLVGVI